MHSYYSTYLTATYNHELNAVITTWHGYVQPDEAKTGFEKIQELFCYYEASYVIADLVEHEGGFASITEWLHAEYLPKMIAAGYKACANIMPEEFLAYISLNDFEDKQAGVVPLRVFADMESAESWISSLQTNQIIRAHDPMQAVA